MESKRAGKTEIVLDAHFDMLMDVLYLRQKGEKNVMETRFLPNLLAGGVNTVICSLFVEEIYVPEGALRNALDQVSALYADLEESPSFRLCTTAAECRAAVADGRIALFLSLEGAEPLGRDLLLLGIFYRLGVRFLGLAWSRRNYACDGVSFLPKEEGSSQGSLTDFGRRLVREADRLGMIIDVSHLNDAGFSEVAHIIRGPFIASHSNCRDLADSPRNLTDEQIRILSAHGGVMGMNAYGPFVADDDRDRTPGALLEHLKRAVSVGGINCAGIGLDLCRCLECLKEEYRAAEVYDVVADHRQAGSKFIGEICERYSAGDAAALLGENFMRVIENKLK